MFDRIVVISIGNVDERISVLQRVMEAMKGGQMVTGLSINSTVWFAVLAYRVCNKTLIEKLRKVRQELSGLNDGGYGKYVLDVEPKEVIEDE